MKLKLSDHDRNRLDGLIPEVEKRTRTQIVLAVIQRSDSYAELPWQAFALGASLTGLVIFLLDLLLISWYPQVTVLITVAGILAGGAVFALLTLLIPGFARQFLSACRTEMEVRQYAKSLFLERELFATQKRTGVLVLVSLFERKVVILPDSGLSDQLTEERMQQIITSMTGLLKQKKLCHAFEAGLDQLSQTLETSGPETAANELSDEIIEEKGI